MISLKPLAEEGTWHRVDVPEVNDETGIILPYRDSTSGLGVASTLEDRAVEIENSKALCLACLLAHDVESH